MESAFSVSHPYKPPRPGSKTFRVWEISDEMSKALGDVAPKHDVLNKYVAEGFDPATGNTQYSKWLQNFRAAQTAEVDRDRSSKPVSPAIGLNEGGWDGHYPLNITPDGGLVIPRALLDEMMLDPDGRVTARVKDGELHIISPMVAIRRAQRIAKSLDRGEGSVVDELIAERRAEAARENEDA
jgi:hypothetical protein